MRASRAERYAQTEPYGVFSDQIFHGKTLFNSTFTSLNPRSAQNKSQQQIQGIYIKQIQTYVQLRYTPIENLHEFIGKHNSTLG